MTLHIACRDWLGIAAALRLKQARPDLDISLPAPDPAVQTVPSAKAAAWLGPLDPALDAYLQSIAGHSDTPIMP